MKEKLVKDLTNMRKTIDTWKRCGILISFGEILSIESGIFGARNTFPEVAFLLVKALGKKPVGKTYLKDWSL